jgi:hypothetical protein
MFSKGRQFWARNSHFERPYCEASFEHCTMMFRYFFLDRVKERGFTATCPSPSSVWISRFFLQCGVREGSSMNEERVFTAEFSVMFACMNFVLMPSNS